MKWQMKATLLGLVVFLVGALALAGGDDRQCTVSYTTGVAGTTATPTSGTCNWGPGATLLMQCDTAVYFSSSGTATSADFIADFAANKDPYIICQLPTQTDVSFLGVTANGSCKFSKTNRRVPCK